MSQHLSDYAIGPAQSASEVPGRGPDNNPYMRTPPSELKKLIDRERDPDKKKQMMSALRQFERQYTYPGYPFKRAIIELRKLANYMKFAEVVSPAINLNQYQETETDQGRDEILDSIKNIHDNDNEEVVDYSRQGIRPIRDIDTGVGDFSAPKEGPFGGGAGPVVKPRGDGPDPDGLEYNDPPTGGNNYDDVFKY